MSKSETQRIQCPNCRTQSNMTVWHSINVMLNPELRAGLFHQNLTEFKCPRCGYSAEFQYDLLYHDQINKFMIWLIFPQEDGTLRVKRNAIEIQPWMRKSGMADYRLRIVNSFNHLLEKILMFENELDDRVLEATKVPMVVGWRVSMERLDSIYFSHLAEHPSRGEVLIFVDPDAQARQLPMPRDLYDAAIETFNERLGPRAINPLEWLLVDRAYAMQWMTGKKPPIQYQLI